MLKYECSSSDEFVEMSNYVLFLFEFVNRGGYVNQVTRKTTEMASQYRHVAKKCKIMESLTMMCWRAFLLAVNEGLWC